MTALLSGVLMAGKTGRTVSLCMHVSILDVTVGSNKPLYSYFLNSI